ncbi:MAG: retropepsin-like aspartic protease family protein [Pseudomonadota bacterium]
MLRAVAILAILAVGLAIFMTRLSEKDFSKAASSVTIAAATAPSQETLVFERDANGHFMVEMLVDGVYLDFMVDTGASVVALSPKDARSLDLRLREADYVWSYQSANGIGKAAPVTLRRMSVGNATVHDVDAAVLSTEMDSSLLGQSFLRKLKGFEVSGDRLIFIPNE